MKRLSITTAFLIIFTVIINAQETQARKKGFVDVGPSVYALDVENMETFPFASVKVNIGFLPSPNHQLSFEAALCYHRGKLWDYEDSPTFEKYGNKIKKNTTAVLFLFTYNFVIRPSNLFHIRLGPAAGFTVLSTSFTTNSVKEIDKEDWDKMFEETDVSMMFSLCANIIAIE